MGYLAATNSSIIREIQNQRSLYQVQVETDAAAHIEQREQIDWSFRG
jgi:hypothetical protein